MIQSFRNKALRRFFESGTSRGLSVQDTNRLRRILLTLNAAGRPEDMDLPGYYYHRLSGRGRDRYSVRMTGNWRVTFGWDGEDATDVDLEDYH